MFAFYKSVSFLKHSRKALGRNTLPYRWCWRATCMAHGFVDLKARRDVPRATAALLALNECVSEFSVGCRPLEVQLLRHERCAYLRVLLLVDAADVEWITQTGWVHKYTAKHREASELFFMPWPKCTSPGAVERALHTAEVLGSVMAWFGFHNVKPKEISVTWRPATLAAFHAFLTGEDTEWVRPLSEVQREGLFRHAETLKARLHPPPEAPSEPPPERATTWAHASLAEFPALGASPIDSSPVATPPCDAAVPRINKEDQENLWGVAFLGACERFSEPPERVWWLRGPSPIDLQKRVALSQRERVAYSDS